MIALLHYWLWEPAGTALRTMWNDLERAEMEQEYRDTVAKWDEFDRWTRGVA